MDNSSLNHQLRFLTELALRVLHRLELEHDEVAKQLVADLKSFLFQRLFGGER